MVYKADHFYGMDIINAGDASASNQVIRNNVQGNFIADWNNKIQNTEQVPIMRTYKLFNKILDAKASYMFERIVSIELQNLQNFELVITI